MLYRVIDVEYKDYYAGVSIDFDKYYKVKNLETKEEKWIDQYKFWEYKRLGLIAENK